MRLRTITRTFNGRPPGSTSRVRASAFVIGAVCGVRPGSTIRQTAGTTMPVSIWEKVAAIAESVAAVGTLAAVVVALWLAKRQGAPQVRLRAGIYAVISGGPPPRSVQGRVVRIGVVNSGLRDSLVTGIGWRVGLFNKAHFFILLADGSLPRKLSPAEEVSITIPWAQFEKDSHNLRAELRAGWIPGLRRKTLRVATYLSTGENVYAKPDAPLRTFLATGQVPTRPEP